jgi:hypothetical protein
VIRVAWILVLRSQNHLRFDYRGMDGD